MIACQTKTEMPHMTYMRPIGVLLEALRSREYSWKNSASVIFKKYQTNRSRFPPLQLYSEREGVLCFLSSD